MKFLIFFAVLLFGIGEAVAGGYRLIDQDAKATARGNAFVATADTPSAVHYNPAGISQLEGNNYQLGYFATSLDVDYRDPEGRSSSTKNKVKGPPQLYLTSSIKDSPFSYGLGLNSPFGLGVEWPDDTGFRTVGTESEMFYLTFSSMFAWKLSDKFSLGAGPTLNYGDLTLKQGLSPNGSDDYFNIELDGWSSGFRLGALWQPSSQHSFGLTYSSNSYLNFKGNTSGDGIPGSTANLSLPFPEYITFGYSYRPTEVWNIEANIDWTNWDRLNTANLNSTPLGDLDLPLNWNSTFAYSLGLTRAFSEDYFVSLGYLFNENAEPDQFFTPIVPDTEKNFLNIGVGGPIASLEWIVAYQALIAKDREISGAPGSPQGQSVDGKYEFTQHSLTFSLIGSF